MLVKNITLRKVNAYKIQEMKIRKERIQDMEVMQQGALRNLFNSPINHQRM